MSGQDKVYVGRWKRAGLWLALAAATFFSGCRCLGDDSIQAVEFSDMNKHDEDVVWLGFPAEDWRRDVFPLGNGRMGCTVFGGVEQERIQFNVDSLWTGNDDTEFGHYQNFGDLRIDIKGAGETTAYRRELSLSRAVSRVTYARGDVQFLRETFCSNPHQVMVSRLSANQAGQYSGRISLADTRSAKTVAVGNRLTYSGTLPNGMEYEAQLLAVVENGGLKAEGNALVFE
jgi:alpha-L-fucosidase 2